MLEILKVLKVLEVLEVLGVLAVLALAVLGRTVLPTLSPVLLAALCLAGVAAPLLALPVQAHAGRLLAGRDGKVAGLIRIPA